MRSCPGVHEWERIYNNPVLWHFRFHGSTPEALVRKAPLPELRYTGSGSSLAAAGPGEGT
jgi:hypothetical protein